MGTIKKLLLLLFCGISILAYTQEGKFKISMQGGWMTKGNIFSNGEKIANYKELWGWNAGGDVNYFFTNRFFAGVHYNYGQISYDANLRDPKSDSRFRNDKAQGVMDIINIGLTAGYCFPVSSLVNLTGQIGFAQFIEMDRYPAIVYIPDGGSSTGFDERIDYSSASNFFSASFPVKFSIGVMPFKKLNAGLAKNFEIAYVFGWYIEPDYGFFTGIYHGPQLSFLF